MSEGRSVLILDDSPSFRALVAVVLERAGYAVTQAGDSAHAVELLTHGTFSAILLDFKMPHDGVAMIDYMSQNLPHLLARTIVFIPSVNRPIWGVLSKPVEPAELVAAVADCSSSAVT